MASRFRRQILVPRLERPIELFEQHKDILRPLIDFLAARGRLPSDIELTNSATLCDVFGSLKRAFHLIERATDATAWRKIADERTQDLLIYLALSRFDGRPSYLRLPSDIQLDI